MSNDCNLNVGDIVADGFKHDNYKRNIGMIINIEYNCSYAQTRYTVYWFRKRHGAKIETWYNLENPGAIVKIVG